MRRWIKRHGRKLFMGVAIFFFLNAILGLTINRPEGGWIILHAVNVVLWGLILLVITGLFNKIRVWWEKE